VSRSAKGVLPRAVGRGQDFTNSHALHALPERVAVDRVAIAEEIGWRGVVGEGVHDLLGRPGGGGMLGDVEVEDTPPMVGKDDQDEEHAQARGRDREEIDGDQVPVAAAPFPRALDQAFRPAYRGRPPVNAEIKALVSYKIGGLINKAAGVSDCQTSIKTGTRTPRLSCVDDCERPE
jgi:hypothetical protein